MTESHDIQPASLHGNKEVEVLSVKPGLLCDSLTNRVLVLNNLEHVVKGKNVIKFEGGECSQLGSIPVPVEYDRNTSICY